MLQPIRLVMPDGVEVLGSRDGFSCPSMPSLAKVLNFLYPCHENPRITAERVGRRYGWRIEQAIKAVDEQYRNYEGVGL